MPLLNLAAVYKRQRNENLSELQAPKYDDTRVETQYVENNVFVFPTDNPSAAVGRRHDGVQLPRAARRAAAQHPRPPPRNHERRLRAVQEGQGGQAGLGRRHFRLGGARAAEGRVQGRKTKMRSRRESFALYQNSLRSFLVEIDTGWIEWS